MFLIVICLINICFASSEARQKSGLISIENFKDLYLKKADKNDLLLNDITRLEIKFDYDKTTDIKISLRKGSIELSNFINCTFIIYSENGNTKKNIDSKLGEKLSFTFLENTNFSLNIKSYGEKLDCLIKPENESDEFKIRPFNPQAELRNFKSAQQFQFEILKNVSIKFNKFGENSYMMAILYNVEELFFKLVASNTDEESKHYLVPLIRNKNDAIKYMIQSDLVNLNIWLGLLEDDALQNESIIELSRKIDQHLGISN